MRYEYFKIIDPAFVQSLLDGNLYMNSLNYFRTLEESAQKEGNKAQKDPMEGACGTISKKPPPSGWFSFQRGSIGSYGQSCATAQ